MKVQRVAVLGGGMAALTAAFELTRPELAGQFDVTVYQMGWRLGGKGASGRNPERNQRIEEHGLHVLLGSYENTFRVLRDCYEELGRRPGVDRFATVEEMCKPHDFITLMEKVGDRWVHWPLNFPSNRERPGKSQTQIPTPWEYVQLLMDLIADLVRGLFGELVGGRGRHDAEIERALAPGTGDARDERSVVQRVLSSVDRLRGAVTETSLSGAKWLDLATMLVKQSPNGLAERLSWVLQSVRKWIAERVERVMTSTIARRTAMMVDLAIAANVGLLDDGLVYAPYDWFKIDDLDLRAWLMKHGASERSVNSPLVRAIYDLAFSREGQAAAGTSAHGILRMVWTYRGSIFYKMQAGMGECVFAPLYEVLHRRGVKFEFFHRVDELVVSDDNRRVAAIELGVQAKPHGVYDPLLEVDGLRCWPSAPLYDQLENGSGLRRSGENLENHWTRWPDAGRRRLEHGRDFDEVVLGMSVGALPSTCRQLCGASARFNDMVTNIVTVQTQSAQLWMTPSIAELGWPLSSTVLDGYADPYDTWADMTHLLDEERWPMHARPGSLAYLCGQLEDDEPVAPRGDHGYPQRQLARARTHAQSWLTDSAAGLWPRAMTANGFDWRMLAGSSREDHARLGDQYFSVPLNPSDRYVLSAPGTHRYRLRSDEAGFDNLVLAGDWVKTALSVGCLEAATMAGMQAAQALAGVPLEIVGDLPRSPRRRSSRVPGIRGPIEIERAMPAYIERGGELVIRAPLQMQQTRLSGFVLSADRAALTRLTDQVLNAVARPHGVEYRPAAPFVSLVFADCRRGQAREAPDRDKGWLAERDVAFWVPLIAGRRDEGRFVGERLVWFLPYIFADNAAAVATGREIYGFPKQQGILRFAGDPGQTGFSVETIVIDRFGPDAAGRIAPLLRAAPITTDSSQRSLWQRLQVGVGEMMEQFERSVFPDLRGARELTGRMGALLQRWFDMRTNLVFLKQFRDAADSSRACYQAIVEAPATVDAMRTGGRLPPHRIEILDADSHPIVRELGLSGPIVTSIAGAWLDFDFTMQSGREVVTTGRIPLARE